MENIWIKTYTQCTSCKGVIRSCKQCNNGLQEKLETLQNLIINNKDLFKVFIDENIISESYKQNIYKNVLIELLKYGPVMYCDLEFIVTCDLKEHVLHLWKFSKDNKELIAHVTAIEIEQLEEKITHLSDIVNLIATVAIPGAKSKL